MRTQSRVLVVLMVAVIAYSLASPPTTRLAFERYWEGEEVAYGPSVQHDLRSVSKSIVGMVYGIALAECKVSPPEAKLHTQFPEYADLAAAPGRYRLTIAHVLSMTLDRVGQTQHSPSRSTQ